MERLPLDLSNPIFIVSVFKGQTPYVVALSRVAFAAFHMQNGSIPGPARCCLLLFASYRFLPRFSHLCSSHKSVHFTVLSLCIGCWLVRFVSDSILCAGFTQAGRATP